MKLNGKNFITDKDILVTNGKHIGSELSQVLDTQQE